MSLVTKFARKFSLYLPYRVTGCKFYLDLFVYMGHQFWYQPRRICIHIQSSTNYIGYHMIRKTFIFNHLLKSHMSTLRHKIMNSFNNFMNGDARSCTCKLILSKPPATFKTTTSFNLRPHVTTDPPNASTKSSLIQVEVSHPLISST